MKARADLEEGTDPAPHDDLALGRVGDPGEDLEERALAGTISPDDAEDLAALDLEVDVFEGPEGILRLCILPESPDRMTHGVRETLREPLVGPVHPYPVLLGEALHLDDRFIVPGCHVTPDLRSISPSCGDTGRRLQRSRW